jgi:hypothetical protein
MRAETMPARAAAVRCRAARRSGGGYQLQRRGQVLPLAETDCDPYRPVSAAAGCC